MILDSFLYDGVMIRHLSGTVITHDLGSIVLDVNGVGYLVHISNETAKVLSGKATVSVWTYLSVRENALDLFGFANTEELSLFEMLLSVSGIGPKSALAVLSLASPDLLRRAIAQNDLAYLTKVSGIGKKTAEKILVELKDKIGYTGVLGDEFKGDGDVLEVLTSLGYSQHEAREAIKKISAELSGTSERVKEALQILGGKK